MIDPYKKKSKIGVKKAIGQLNNVLQMIDSGAYCMDILQQARAVQGLLNSLSANILESHLHTCGKRAFVTDDVKQHKKIIDELIVAFKAVKK